MSGVFVAGFHSVTVTAAQDLIALTSTAGMAFEVIGFGIGAANASSEVLQFNLKRLTATVTPGSSGSSVTPVPDATSQAAATVTARRNDTTIATTSGATTYLHPDAINLANGYLWFYPAGALPRAAPGEAIILELAVSPGGSRTMSGWVKFRELY